MKKSLLAIAFAVATLSLGYAQTPAPASQPDQKSTTATTTKKTTKTTKHHAKKSSATKSTTSAPAQK